MSGVRGMMARFYREHGLADPESSVVSVPRIMPRQRVAPRRVDNEESAQERELQQIRREITDFTRSSGQQLESFRADLERHFGTLEALQANKLKAQEYRLGRERSSLNKQLNEMETQVIAQEALLTEARCRVLKDIETHLPKLQRNAEPAPPERVYREQDTCLAAVMEVSPGQHDKALGLLSWLQTNKMPENAGGNGEAIRHHLETCPLLKQMPHAQFCELICLLKTLPNHLWRNHVTAFARLMG